MAMEVELQATCSALGYQEGKLYVKEPDCLETVKDLIRFLKREDETCDIRRQLGHACILQNDLLPILRQYKDEATLWETVVRLLVNLTQPAVLCFNGSVPEDKTTRNYYLEVVSHLQDIKEAFISEETFAVLTDKLGDLLKLDWEHRQEEHRLLIERVLILIRNILHIPPDPTAEQRTDDDASIHDQVLWAMHVSGLEDVLLYIASSEEERNLSMHILEIVSLMFREQKPEMLASAGSHRSVTEKEKDERELEMVREQERLQKKAAVMKHSTRHSRFGGTFVVKNFKSISERDLIYHKAQADANKINLDNNKKPKKKPKNRKPIIDREVTRRSTLSIRLSLKEFCVQFLENCYNPLMYAVKDVLNREKSQEHDETYYLWSMRFFMEFCRHHSGAVDLVSETMSVQTFHYIQVQMFQYYEMQTMEKKEAIVWGKRVHLALKAYQELLLTLDSMDKSNNNTLMESSKVIKSNIFYVMEFRDIFITLLRHFNQNNQSRTYLKDLVETTHLFMKMLENFSKRTGHLIVQKKGKGKKKKKPRQPAVPQGPVEPTEQELEDLWDEVSGELSAIFQGRSEVPEGIQPFDAASEVDMDEQRIEAMIRIQDCLRSKTAGEAVGLFRAAREVWPGGNEFGTPDIAPEDEFMALREIFMTALPRPSPEVPMLPEEIEEAPEMEEEEEMPQHFEMAEQEFVFRDFFIKFAKPEIMKPYVLLLADFQKNSIQTNHCCVKMLHRMAVDLGYVGMLFQISLFRVFQNILLSPLAKAQRYKELSKFAVYVVRRFVEVAQNNSKVFMEIMFWKTNKEAIEIVEGYGSYQGKAKVLWNEDAEQEVHRLFEEYRENEEDGKDTVDHIMERITDLSKTRGQIIRELKRQDLITSAKDLKKPKGGSSRAGPWREEDELELTELYQRFKHSDDPVGGIMSEMCKGRSRPKIMEKLLTMGLVADRKDLYKKRASKSGARSRHRRGSGSDDDDGEGFRELPSDYEDDVGSGQSDDEDRRGGSGDSSSSSSSSDADDEDGAERREAAREEGPNTMAGVIAGIVDKGYKDQIAWLQRLLRRTAEDREDEDSFVPVPIVPLTEENETAMEDEVFLSFLTNIGMAAPANEQECFWRIPPQLSPLDLYNIIAGLFLDEDNKPVNADKIDMKQPEPKKQQKKEKKKKIKKKKNDDHKAPKKNANKFAALKELVKKKAVAKKTKRIRNKQPSSGQEDSDVQDSEEAGTQTPSKSSEAGSQDRGSSSKKRKRVKKFVPSDSDDSDEDIPLTSLRTQSDSEAGNQSPSRDSGPSSPQKTPGSDKRKRLAMLASSDSDSDEDIPLTTLKSKAAETVKNAVTGTQSSIDSQSQSETGTHSSISSQSQGETGTQSSKDSQSQDRNSDSEDQSQSQEAPLLFLSSSDESDQETGTKSSPSKQSKADNSGDEKGSTQSSKRSRSRSTDSDPESGQPRKKVRMVDSSDSEDDRPLSSVAEGEGGQPRKKVRMVDSSDSEDDRPLSSVAEGEGGQPRKKVRMVDSSDSEDDRPLSSVAEGEGGQPRKKVRMVDSSDSEDDRPLSSVAEETFPATLNTQGPESDSDMDDHVPLRKVIQKKNIIESDDED